MTNPGQSKVRFRVEFIDRGNGRWEFIVHDLDDHGPDLPYAQGTCGTLLRATQLAGHYVAVAE